MAGVAAPPCTPPVACAGRFPLPESLTRFSDGGFIWGLCEGCRENKVQWALRQRGDRHRIVERRGEVAFASDTRNPKLSSFRIQMPVPSTPRQRAAVIPPASDGPHEPSRPVTYQYGALGSCLVGQTLTRSSLAARERLPAPYTPRSTGSRHTGRVSNPWAERSPKYGGVSDASPRPPTACRGHPAAFRRAAGVQSTSHLSV